MLVSQRHNKLLRISTHPFRFKMTKIFNILKSVISNKEFQRRVFQPFAQRFSSQGHQKKQNFLHRNLGKIVFGTVAGLLTYTYKNHHLVYNKKASPPPPDACDATLPFYTLEEVSKHNSPESRIWVTFKGGVYDITDFIEGHPGGSEIYIAAGTAVEPFWTLYPTHYNSHVLDILATLRIGNLCKEDIKRQNEAIRQQSAEVLPDPYENAPIRHPKLHGYTIRPFNGQVPTPLLVEKFITPNEFFYVRTHLPIPDIDIATYQFEVEVEGETVVFNFDDLKKFPEHTITATLMCAGNRRAEMIAEKPVMGFSWGAGAISNAKWTGVRLRDVLKSVGVDEDDKRYGHVIFEGMDFDGTGTNYEGSIPFWKAMDKRGDTILAYKMNGVPLPRDHGYPLRIIAPGHAGTRNVKWLNKIIVSETESDKHWQQVYYKGFNPSVTWDTANYKTSPAIQELPVTSAICTPTAQETVTVEDGHILVKGYAWSGGGQRIVRVDVTGNGGDTWYIADLEQDSTTSPQHWSWTLWSCRVPIPEGTEEVELWVKAVDSCYNGQPETFKNIWNFRGVLNNAYNRVPIKIYNCKGKR